MQFNSISFKNGCWIAKIDSFAARRLIIFLDGFECLGDDTIKISFDSNCTFIDERVIFDALTHFKGSSVSLSFFSGIAGTIPEEITINSGEVKKVYCVPDQGISGVNCHIGRPLRKKIFSALLSEFSELTTIEQPVQLMGEMAAWSIMERLRKPLKEPSPLIVPTTLVVRNSTKRLAPEHS